MQSPSAFPSTEITVFIGVLLIMLLLAPLILQLVSPASRLLRKARKIEKRVKAGQHKERVGQQKQASLRKQEGDTSLPLFSALLSKMRSSKALRYRLARSGLDITAERYMVYSGFLFILTVLILSVMDKGLLFSLLIGIVVSLGLPHIFIGFKIEQQTKHFLKLFPDAIDLIVRGLRAGLPATESMKMVAKEIEAPVGTVFQTISDKMALGIPLEKTLYETAARYRITEFDFFVTSIALQRETGGNLSEILANLSEALRQRLMMRLKIKAMSSEARASMYIIGALPVLVMLALKVISPEYLEPLFTDYRGNISLAVAGGMLFTGIYIMLRMAKFEI